MKPSVEVESPLALDGPVSTSAIPSSVVVDLPQVPSGTAPAPASPKVQREEEAEAPISPLLLLDSPSALAPAFVTENLFVDEEFLNDDLFDVLAIGFDDTSTVVTEDSGPYFPEAAVATAAAARPTKATRPPAGQTTQADINGRWNETWQIIGAANPNAPPARGRGRAKTKAAAPAATTEVSQRPLAGACGKSFCWSEDCTFCSCIEK
jgi:hypothetical protein